jgi:hypothetical protein
MRGRSLIGFFIILSSVLIFAPNIGLMQGQSETCPELVVEEALSSVGGNCSDMDRNTACYGYDQVSATRRQEGGPDFFTQPNARAQLAAIETIQTGPNDQGSGWGIAVLNVQANVPESVPGQAVNFLLLGGTEIENAVPSANSTSSPMEAFYFRPGFGPAVCSRVPSALALRSPEDLTVDLTANGAHIRLGSIAILRVLPPGNTMQLMTIEGLAVLEPETTKQLSVPAGFSTLTCLSEPDNLGVDGSTNDREVISSCSWAEPIALTAEEIALGETVKALFDRLNGCANGGTDVVHVVRTGENLFRIARRYSTTVATIAANNNISNPAAITPGQELVIHCAVDTGASTFPPVILIPVTSPLAAPK